MTTLPGVKTQIDGAREYRPAPVPTTCDESGNMIVIVSTTAVIAVFI